MRTLASLLTLVALFTCQRTRAQGEPAIVPNAQPVGPQKPVQQYYVEDGGAHGEVLESIVIPPKLNAPFTLLLQTEWVRGLPDGGSIATVNERRIARDAEGRIYMERWYLVPKDGKVKSEMTAIQISDSSNHTLYSCFMLDPKKRCVLVTYTPSPNAVFKFQGPPTGPLPDGMGEAIHEDLGTQLVSGVETIGTRHIVIYSILLVPISLLPWALGLAGAIYGVIAVTGGALFVGLALRLRRAGAFYRRAAHRLFGFSIVYLFVLFAALLADSGGKASAIVLAWTSIIVSAVGA